jgi:MFS family permease
VRYGSDKLSSYCAVASMFGLMRNLFTVFQFDVSPGILGLLFLLMSAFYAVFSPIWGWIADRMVSCVFISSCCVAINLTMLLYPTRQLFLQLLALSASIIVICTYAVGSSGSYFCNRVTSVYLSNSLKLLYKCN